MIGLTIAGHGRRQSRIDPQVIASAHHDQLQLPQFGSAPPPHPPSGGSTGDESRNGLHDFVSSLGSPSGLLAGHFTNE
ncbi:hypothetical protein [Hoeflea marina]|uniref:hypothetical protein n=1 Tax=Hoeflea marina TaxID=274592 RepID=UPI0011B454DA|nr:hypothetical protein [Hoeflea marina]